MRKPVVILQMVVALLIGLFLLVITFFPPQSVKNTPQMTYISDVKITPQLTQEEITSEADLSYILVSGGEDSEIEIRDNNNQKIGDSSISRLHADGTNASDTNSAIMEYYVPQPESGEYTLSVMQGTEEISLFLYDKNAEAKVFEIPNVGDTRVRYKIFFDKENIQNSSYVQK